MQVPSGHAIVSVGVSGCGRIARTVHIPVLANLPTATIVTLADTDRDSLEAAARIAPTARRVSDHAELCAQDDVDAVVICSPSGLHADAAVAALEHGKALYLEKPIAMDLPGAERVVDVWRRSGRPAMIGFNFRFHPLALDIRRRVDAGEIGDLVCCRSAFSAPAHARPDWKQTVAAGGGVLLDYASHHVDLLRFLTGRDIRDVLAAIRSDTCEEDSASLQMTLGAGRDAIAAQGFFSWNSVQEDRVEIVGTRGSLAFDRYTSLGVHARSTNLHYDARAAAGRLAARDQPALRPQPAGGASTRTVVHTRARALHRLRAQRRCAIAGP